MTQAESFSPAIEGLGPIPLVDGVLQLDDVETKYHQEIKKQFKATFPQPKKEEAQEAAAPVVTSVNSQAPKP